jgi:hypothetical protein
MYEYVQTATGWKLYWGAAVLHRQAPEQPRLTPVEIDRTTQTGQTGVDHEPVTSMSA